MCEVEYNERVILYFVTLNILLVYLLNFFLLINNKYERYFLNSLES